MSEDAKLTQRVLEELKWQPSIDAAHIEVTAHDGVITLTGHVGSFAQKCAAEKVTIRMAGVKALAEEIEVRLPSENKRSDEDIAAAAVHCLSWDSFVPHDRVKVTVEKGWLTLSGKLNWSFERKAAANAVAHLKGVKGITNDITLKLRANAKSISEDIKTALTRSWFSEPSDITVTVNDGDVLLTGTVHSLEEKRKAAWTAWCAPGAIDVKNNITVL
ncbi:MAG: BON domain-containing protein [bacterium]|nr:BON domain-containing protein [bacterium]